MKIYQGRREGAAAIVTVNHRPLNPRRDVWNHSPTGFEWGYAGSGPAQLALAILADHLGSADEALSLYHDFKRVVVARLPYHGWRLTSFQINQFLQRLSSRSLDGESNRLPDTGGLKLSELLSQVTPPPWSFVEGRADTGIPTLKLLGWRGANPQKQMCIGRFGSPADAQYACHAAALFLEVVTALKLLLDDRKRPQSELSLEQFDFCGRALADAERIQLE